MGQARGHRWRSAAGETSGEIAEIREPKKKKAAELRRANEILRTATAFFPAELDRLEHLLRDPVPTACQAHSA